MTVHLLSDEAPETASLRARIRQFFADNPHEFLTHEDACAKFGVSSQSMSNALSALRQEGLIESGWAVWRKPDRY